MKNRKTGCKRTRKSGALLPVFCLSASLLLSGCGQADETEAYVRGIGALRNNDYASAIANFETAVKDGREAEGYRGIGIADMYLGEYEKAEDFFSKALNAVVHPDQNRQFMEDVLYYQAQAYVLQEKYEDASTIYNQLLEGKNPGQAYLLRGKIYAAQNKFGQAGQDFQKAVERNPSYEYYLEIYDVYVKNNRQADGAAFLQEAQRRSPSTGEDYY
jgi:tetratricopeptide (TPR) repeat protein